MSFTVNPRSTNDALLAWLVFVLLVLLYMAPAAASVIYLLRRVDPRSGGEEAGGTAQPA